MSANTRSRTSSESSKASGAMQHTMSPRLPRKSRQPAAFSSTSKLDSPGSLQMDQDGRISPITLTSPSSSPYTSRLHKRDKAYADKYGSLDIRQSHENKPRDKFSSLDRSAAMSRYGYRDQRDRSVERSGTGDYTTRSSSLQRNRSLDRDYPLVSLSMRSLADGVFDPADPETASDLRYQQSQSSMLILSLQTQLVDLNKDYTISQRELEQSKSQLNSYIASVKTFWSPELKKERALRKEETQKFQKTQEMLSSAQHEKQVAIAKLQNAEERLTLQGIRDSSCSPVSVISQHREEDRQEKELRILQSTVTEMEQRIELQKKTLAARDASINKLVEMLQTKNIPIETILNSEAEKDDLRSEIGRLQHQLSSAENDTKNAVEESSKLQRQLSNLKMELSQAHSSVSQANRQSKNLDDVQSLLDMKNTRISELEKELQSLEKQVDEIRNSSSEQVSEEKRHIEALHSHEQVLKSKLENLKLECSSKSTEICSLQSRIDSIQSQRSDLEQHIDILKQQLQTKDANIDLVKNEMNRLEAQVRDRDSDLEKKNSQLESLKTDKIQLEGDLADVRYEGEVSARKITLLQKKVDNSAELLKEKDDEISTLESRISSLSKTSTHNETIDQLQTSLDEKNKQLERMKQQLDTAANDRSEELTEYQNSNRELSKELELLRQSSEDSKVEILSLQENLSELKSQKLKLDSQLNQSEKSCSVKLQEVESLNNNVSKLKNDNALQQKQSAEQLAKINEMSEHAKEQAEQLQKYQHEIDRLLEILKAMENEKHNKDKQIRELQEQLKEVKQKFVNLKKTQRQEDNKSAGSADSNGDINVSEMQARTKRYKARIEELEEALKQSVKITAKCEMVVATQKEEIDKQERLIQQYKGDVAKATEISIHVHDLEESLQDKNEQLRKLVAERGRHMEELYEMKQEAILAAISEKDSHIALLEAAKTKNARDDIEKLNNDKQRLNLRLKDLTTQRMLLVVEQSSDNARKLSSQQNQDRSSKMSSSKNFPPE
ncbi:ELKS/Rab6-interacting/CAST family member 1-like isoform X2 [Watersipora subatra]|uniref:ELKS/Rab6-interacting/CAST family member 1-like isoform X2 n=1 Tax=Watersipora subatra TaxID=2589382 RepID=UPI00355B38CF